MVKKFKSLKMRLFLTVCIVVIIIILFFVIVSKTILESFHYRAKVKDLLEINEQINSQIEIIDENELEKICIQKNLDMVIKNNENIIYTDKEDFSNNLKNYSIINENIKYSIFNKSDILYSDEEKTIRRIQDKNNGIEYILIDSILEDGTKTGTYKINFGNTFQTLLSEENGDAELKAQYQSAIEALIYENPDIFYLDVTKMYINIEKITKITGTKYNVYIDNGREYTYLTDGFYTKEDIEEYETLIEQAKNAIISSVQGQSDYQKIKYIHNYLIDTIQYQDDLTQNNIYDIYGALVEKRCVCEGYAKAFQYLMNEIGIENTIVIGTGTNSRNQTENHAWNYVKLKGQWYAIDVTWDDPIITGGGGLTNKSRYKYFLKGSKTMSENHIPSGRFTENGQVFKYPELSIEDYE